MSGMYTSVLLLDVFSYTASMSLLSWRRSTGLLSQMRLRGLKPDVVCFSSTLSADEALPWQQASKILGAMSLQGVLTNEVCCNAATAALGQQWEVALAAFQVWQAWLSLSLVSIVSELRGAWTRCLELVTKTQERQSVFSKGALMMELQMQQQWHLALSQFQFATLGGLKPDSYLRSLSVTAPASARMWETSLKKLCHFRSSYAFGPVIVHILGTTCCGVAVHLPVHLQSWDPRFCCFSKEFALCCLAQQDRHIPSQDGSRMFSALLTACGKTIAWQAALILVDAGISACFSPIQSDTRIGA